MIQLSKEMRVVKTAKNQIEIPSQQKSYVLIEPDKCDGVECSTSIDEWLENIERVI